MLSRVRGTQALSGVTLATVDYARYFRERRSVKTPVISAEAVFQSVKDHRKKTNEERN